MQMREAFITALNERKETFGVELGPNAVARLADYYELVKKHNDVLHLVAPSSMEDPEEFVTRHILESLTLLEFLPRGAKFADVGTGAGLPGIPCLLAREDLHGFLIESKLKKAQFLNEVRHRLNLHKRLVVIARQFEEFKRPDVRVVTCRAIDKFTQKLPALLKWSAGAYLVFYGGENLREELKKHGLIFREKLMPLSEKRFVFQIKKSKV